MTLSREQIATIIERKHPNIPKDIATKLGRDLHVAITTKLVRERDDAYIKAVVAGAKAKMKKSSDIVAECNRWLMKSEDIPYVDQKIIQWFITEAYSAGLKKGKNEEG